MKAHVVSDDDNSFVAPFAAESLGRWCHVWVRFPPRFRPKVAMISIESSADDPDAHIYYINMPPIARWAGYGSVVAYVPANATDMRITVFGHASDADNFFVIVTPIRKWQAGFGIALRHPVRMIAAMRGGARGIRRRIRTTMAVIATGQPPDSYELWTEQFDTWTDWRNKRLLASNRRASWPSIEARICTGDAGTAPSAATMATRHALDRQLISVSGESTGAEYVAVIQAGEVLPCHAMALLADWIVALDRPDAIYADEDAITNAGHRHSPVFKPEPNHTLMLSGTLATGVWLIRRSCLAELAEPASRWAAALRLATWLQLHERGGARKTHRIPYILTHRRNDCEPEPAAIMATIVKEHLHRLSVSAWVEPTWPISVQPRLPTGTEPHVTIVVPSTCRSSHVLHCLTVVASNTSYPSFDIVVVLSQKADDDDRQKQIIAALEANDKIRVVLHKIDTDFNYAAANNFGVSIANGPLVCLLNDDVEPIRPDWLMNLAGHFSDPVAGIVGAKLYYSNDQVQHGGVIMGLAGLCDHVNRFLPRCAPGYAYRGIVDQQFSAVTGACLLIERAFFNSIGGMDEHYASAFNDVDLCLKAGEVGRSVIFSARSELYHHESLSFVQHYGDAESARWATDVALMRRKWHRIIANDPFHNPNLSKQRGHEWAPAFPPRAINPAH